MIGCGARALAAALLLAVPAHAAEGGIIRGGEHDGFSRIVMTIEPTTEWSLEGGADAVTIRFPGRRLGFDTRQVFDRMPATRILAVTTADEGGGTVVRIALGCTCRVSSAFVGGRYLALDVSEPGPAPDASPGDPGGAGGARDGRRRLRRGGASAADRARRGSGYRRADPAGRGRRRADVTARFR